MSAKKTEVSTDTLVSLVVQKPATVNDGTAMIERINGMSVTDANTYELVSMVRHSASQTWIAFEKERVEMKRPVLEAQRKIDDFFKPILAAYASVKDIATKKLSDYDTEQRRIAAEKQREADALAARQRQEAEEVARKERERVAELERQQRAEEQRQALARQTAAREAAEATAREEKAKREAAEAAAAGDKARAEQAEAEARVERQKAINARVAQLKAEATAAMQNTLANEAIETSQRNALEAENTANSIRAEVVQADVPEVAGISRVSVWKWELLDKSKVKSDYIVLDEKLISKVVSTAKGRAAEIVGGIRVFEEKLIRQR